MPLFVLLIIFIAVPILELWLILEVAKLLGGDAGGAALTIALLIADSMLGAWLARSQGRRVLRQLNHALSEGRMPTREVVDGAFVLVGGVLLLTPGFLSDFLGVLMLLPPTRALLRRPVLRSLSRRIRSVSTMTDTGLRDFPHAEQSPARSQDRTEAGARPVVPDPLAIETDVPDFDFNPESRR